MVAIDVADIAGVRAQILDNIQLAFPYYYESDPLVGDVEFKIVVRQQDDGYVGEFYYYGSQGWTWFMRSGVGVWPKDALESLLRTSAALLRDAQHNKGLPSFVGEAKEIGEGLFQEHPQK